MDKIVSAHSAQQIRNFQELQVLHPPGWQHSAEAPHPDMQPALLPPGWHLHANLLAPPMQQASQMAALPMATTQA